MRFLQIASLVVSLALLSATGIAMRALGYPSSIPRFIVESLEAMIEPGLAVWWFTLGGAFQAFPDGATGYALVVAANVVFWLLVVAVLAGVARAVLRRSPH